MCVMWSSSTAKATWTWWFESRWAASRLPDRSPTSSTYRRVADKRPISTTCRTIGLYHLLISFSRLRTRDNLLSTRILWNSIIIKNSRLHHSWLIARCLSSKDWGRIEGEARSFLLPFAYTNINVYMFAHAYQVSYIWIKKIKGKYFPNVNPGLIIIIIISWNQLLAKSNTI